MDNLGIRWDTREAPISIVSSTVPEFSPYIERYGTGYLSYDFSKQDRDIFKTMAVARETAFGLALWDKVFLLPAVFPQTHDKAIEMSVAALQGAIAYRARMMTQLPEWTGDFQFSCELQTKQRADELRNELAEIDSSLYQYANLKGALCYQSNPLVEVISSILNRFFDIVIECDDKCIEDATLKDDEGEILAVFEIKGKTKNFARENVNQVDSHRERLNLPTDTPGLLIMNTIMSAKSLADKDRPPHPDIIAKAVTDNVLLIRTLDLLRYADCVERAIFSKGEFRETILSKAGWLKVENDTLEVVTE